MEPNGTRTGESHKQAFMTNQREPLREDLNERLQRVLGKTRIQILRMTNHSLSMSERWNPEDD
jgi:hypothetical protein